MYWRGDRKKCIGHCKSFQKRSIIFKKHVATPTFYVMKLEVASLFNKALVYGCE